MVQKAASLGSYEATSKLQTLEKKGPNFGGEAPLPSVIKKALRADCLTAVKLTTRASLGWNFQRRMWWSASSDIRPKIRVQVR